MYERLIIILVAVSATMADSDYATGFGVNAMTCYYCDDITSCQEKILEVKNCTNNNDFCHVSFNGSTVSAAGCLDHNNASSCSQPECYKCSNANCNNVKTCLSCESNSDLACAQEPREVKTIVNCTQGCFTKITNDGHTHRGCLKSGDYCNKTNHCTPGYLSNNIVYPADRLHCLQCDHKEDHCQEPSSAITGLPCLLDVSDNECYQSFKDGKIKRGCTKDDPKFKCTDKITCRKCNTTDCNNIFAKKIVVNSSSALMVLDLLVVMSSIGFVARMF